MMKFHPIRDPLFAYQQKFGLAGEAYGRGVMVSGVLATLRRPTYDDEDAVRIRRHTMLYGDQGTVKTIVSNHALTHVFGAVKIEDYEPTVHLDVPTYAEAGGGTTWERLRGGVDPKTGIIPPILPEITFLYAPELSSFISPGPQFKEKVEHMNVGMEEGRMTVAQIKNLAMPLEDRVEAQMAIPEDANYHFNANHAILSYDCTFSFLSCSHKLDEKTWAELQTRGYLSRQAVEQWFPPTTQAEEYASGRFNQAAPSTYNPVFEKAKKRFIGMWRTPVEEVNIPPTSMIQEVVDLRNALYREIIDDIPQLSFNDLASARDNANAAQLITAASTARHFEHRDPDDHTPFAELEYLQEDVDYACLLDRPARDAVYQNAMSIIDEKESDRSIVAESQLVAYLKTLSGDWPDEFMGPEFVDSVVSRASVKKATAQKMLTTCRKRGHIVMVAGQNGHWRVDHKFMRKAGFRDMETEREMLRDAAGIEGDDKW